ncbi:ImmA/IrrE family metallo-endopeptidase [Sphingomonas prati]|uniref:IrrE N-terminal-like domain-containing protein n=1 Tax=Sphingomonas prati TaxID=1843237 RepID=A0A7W9BUL6_9SPHN|nr:ImmA/IrrE family metallo-endopeptidase [Sphingomonas prati]MBB5730423.1 hypothetical protein [Sphingomonas prati]GGE93963.1 ImmA/IrrE family metallo-endopeptidase [Sphingomonas prati]
MINVEHRSILDRYKNMVPVPVGKLAQELGIQVNLALLSPNISGLIEPNSETPSGFHIRVNRYEIPERQRFTIAHEIAHFLLHRDYIKNGIVDNVMYRSGLSSKRETEANRLAAEIVMPRAALDEALENLGGKKDDASAMQLAKIFRVSLPAMKVRLGIA